MLCFRLLPIQGARVAVRVTSQPPTAGRSQQHLHSSPQHHHVHRAHVDTVVQVAGRDAVGLRGQQPQGVPVQVTAAQGIQDVKRHWSSKYATQHTACLCHLHRLQCSVGDGARLLCCRASQAFVGQQATSISHRTPCSCAHLWNWLLGTLWLLRRALPTDWPLYWGSSSWLQATGVISSGACQM